MSGLAVRPFRPGDADAVTALWRAVFPDDPARNDPATIVRRKRAVQPNLFLVGEIDGRIAGAVIGGYDGHRGWIYHLAVAPEHRRRGHGRALVAEMEARLRVLGCPKVNLQVRGGNTDVVGFYERLGYAVEERVSMGKTLG